MTGGVAKQTHLGVDGFEPIWAIWEPPTLGGNLGATHPRRLAVVIVFSEGYGERATVDGCGVVQLAGGICDCEIGV